MLKGDFSPCPEIYGAVIGPVWGEDVGILCIKYISKIVILYWN